MFTFHFAFTKQIKLLTVDMGPLIFESFLPTNMNFIDFCDQFAPLDMATKVHHTMCIFASFLGIPSLNFAE